MNLRGDGGILNFIDVYKLGARGGIASNYNFQTKIRPTNMYFNSIKFKLNGDERSIFLIYL